MSIESIIQSVHHLITLHEQMRDSVQAKTVIVKEGHMEQLPPILAKEQLLIQQIEKEEYKRGIHVEQWFAARGLQDVNRTMTAMFEHLEGESLIELERATAILVHLITEIKEQEHLNHSLIQQSLQFVQMTLHMLQPSIEQLNYGKSQNEQQHGNRSMFDSRA